MSALGIAALGLTALPAWGQKEPIQLYYRAPVGCPDASRFSELLLARTPRVRPAASDERARVFTVVVRSDGNAVRGLLEISSLDGAVTRREATGQNCEEVVSALVLMTVLAIDPMDATLDRADVDPGMARASTEAVATPAQIEPANPTVATSESQPELDTSLTPPPRRKQPRAVIPRPDVALGPIEKAQVRRTTHWRWALGVEEQTLAGLVPTSAFGGGAFVELRRRGNGFWGPMVRVSFFAAATRSTLAGQVGAQFDWFASRIEGCPGYLPLSEHAELTLCAAFDAGVLRATGSGLNQGLSNALAWVAPGVLGRVAWSPIDRWDLEVSGGAMTPLDRYRFDVGRGTASDRFEVYQLPPVGAIVTLGSAYRFP